MNQPVKQPVKPLLDHRPGDHPDTGPTVGSCLGIAPERFRPLDVRNMMKGSFVEVMVAKDDDREVVEDLSSLRRHMVECFDLGWDTALVVCLAKALGTAVAFDVRSDGRTKATKEDWIKVAKRLTVWVRPYWPTHGPQGGQR